MIVRTFEVNFFKKCILTACAVVFASTAGAATIENSNLVVNGSFEDIGDGSFNGRGWNHFSDVPGWTGDPNVEIQSNSTLGSIDAEDGVRYAELDTNQDAAIFQNIALEAGTYDLSFWYSPRVDATMTSTNDMTFSVASLATSYIDTLISGAPNVLFPHGEWTNIVSTFTLTTAEIITLTFAATGGSFFAGCGNCGALIDSVSIAAVPLPAGLLLMLSAFGVFAFVRRRATV